jgi:UbiD family decarboxylase
VASNGAADPWREWLSRRYARRDASVETKGISGMRAQPVQASLDVDLEKFRLRNFVLKLSEIGEIELHDEPVALSDLSAVVEATPRATHFKRVGAEHYEMVAAVCGSRKRLAAALGVGEREIAHEFMRRINNPQRILEVPSQYGPVHEVIRTGDDIDLTRLPFHVQHEFDGGPYISSGIDFTTDPATGKTNVGCRRLMLRGRREMRSNLTDASDLKNIYLDCLKRGERLPVSFAIGSHPIDYMAATCKMPIDEFGLVATLRGEPVPMVRGVTNGVLAPADAEIIIEGYFDELGYRELEGPYGEFYGFYGPVHVDPVFHVTAIAMRKDALHQTVLHSGRFLGRTDSGNLASLHTEVAIWRTLRAVRIEPAAVHVVAASNGRPHARVALRQTAAGQARAAINALFALVQIKHVFVVDNDVDVFSNEEMEWAMASRFRSDRDLVVTSGLPGFYADPTADSARTVAKMGFDLTKPVGQPDQIDNRRAFARRIGHQPPRHQTVRQALESGAMYFAQIMDAMGSRDGREIALALDELREEGILARLDDGQWTLKPATKS